jgi:hypothetical protein
MKTPSWKLLIRRASSACEPSARSAGKERATVSGHLRARGGHAAAANTPCFLFSVGQVGIVEELFEG